MSVIAVVNRKGGSGKSTLATHLAAHFANSGVPVMLGDVDRQQSTQSWLRSRSLRDLPKQRADRRLGGRSEARPPAAGRAFATSSSTRPAACAASTWRASSPSPTSS